MGPLSRSGRRPTEDFPPDPGSPTEPWAYCRRADISEDAGFDAVVAAAGRGEHWALTQLFRAYQPKLIRYLRGQERGVADDLAGEVWLAVAQRLSSYEGDELGFRRWIFTIARCRIIEHRRKAARRRTYPVAHERLDVPGSSGGEAVGGAMGGCAATAGDPAALVVDRLAAQSAIDLIVADLTTDQAEAVLLRVVAGFDVAEVARIMDRTPGSVRVLCHRALRRLADRFPEGMLVE